MRHFFSILTVVLLVLAICLGLEVWRQRRETTRSRQILLGRTSEVAALRGEASALQAKPSAPESGAGRVTSVPLRAPVSSPAADPTTAEGGRENDQVIAAWNKRSFRLNALNSYMGGMDALKLPPEKLGRAKEIILARWEATAKAREGAHSWEEANAVMRPIDEAMDQQLADLLGESARNELKASALENSLDWTLGTEMWDGGVPLAPEQLHAIARARVQMRFEPANWQTTPNDLQRPDPQSGLSRQDDALLAAAAANLSAAQQEIFRKTLIDENNFNAAMRGFVEKQRRLWEARK
jgi:hypothetical protein